MGGREGTSNSKEQMSPLPLSSEACKAFFGPVMLQDAPTCPADCFHSLSIFTGHAASQPTPDRSYILSINCVFGG